MNVSRDSNDAVEGTAALYVRLPPALKRAAARRAAHAGHCLTDFVIRAIEAALAAPIEMAAESKANAANIYCAITIPSNFKLQVIKAARKAVRDDRKEKPGAYSVAKNRCAPDYSALQEIWGDVADSTAREMLRKRGMPLSDAYVGWTRDCYLSAAYSATCDAIREDWANGAPEVAP